MGRIFELNARRTIGLDHGVKWARRFEVSDLHGLCRLAAIDLPKGPNQHAKMNVHVAIRSFLLTNWVVLMIELKKRATAQHNQTKASDDDDDDSSSTDDDDDSDDNNNDGNATPIMVC